MRKEIDMYEKINNEPPVKLEGKDILALIIATIEILLPYLVGGVLIFYLVLLFCTKVWIK